MKRCLYLILTLVFLSLWSSCRKDFEFSPSSGNLGFSKDTVYLDTVFTNIGSSTYNLKVYNRSDEDIVIPSVKLSRGEASNYRLNVDGMPGKMFENIELLAKDSLFIFIETTVDIENETSTSNEFLYEDAIEFDTGANQQKVELVTLIKDAVFIYPDRDNTTKIVESLTLGSGENAIQIWGREFLQDELTMTNEKPYVIYGFMAVPSGETLTINAGARLHFHENSGILVTPGASIHANGAYSSDQDLLENEIILEGDRLEPAFSERPGQWGAIWLFEGSTNNSINYTTIKNALVGILSDGDADAPDSKLTIKNSKIYNCSNFGILGINTSITGENLVVNKSAQSAIALTFGGKYNFTHCSIANYWQNSFRSLPALLINNHTNSVDEDNNEITLVTDLVEANFNNCIIYGNNNPEFLVDEIEGENILFNFKFTNCLIRFEDNRNFYTGDNYDFDNTSLYENNIFNKNPDFKNTEDNMLIIGKASAGINKGNSVFASQVSEDILTQNRTSTPDIGAYQHTDFDEE